MADFITHLHIEGYKSIKKADIELKNLNVVIGANGSGKSNLIGVFKLLNELVEGRLEGYVNRAGGANFFLHFGSKITSKLVMELEFSTGNVRDTYELELTPNNNDTFTIENETGTYKRADRDTPMQIVMGSKYRTESGLRKTSAERTAKGNTARFILNFLERVKVYHFHDTGDTALLKTSGETTDNFSLKSDASNLAAFLYRLREHYFEYYDNIRQTIRLVAPFFNDFYLAPRSENPNSIFLRWRDFNQDTTFTANSLSDGTLRFICLAALLLSPEELMPSVVIIDEPELGLHPYAINILAGLLKKAANKRQIIISTQSVVLLDEFSAEDVIVVDQIKGVSEFNRINQDKLADWLEQYTLGEIWQSNLVGGRPS